MMAALLLVLALAIQDQRPDPQADFTAAQKLYASAAYEDALERLRIPLIGEEEPRANRQRFRCVWITGEQVRETGERFCPAAIGMRDERDTAAGIRMLVRIGRKLLENSYCILRAPLLDVEVGKIEPGARIAGSFRNA